MLKLLPVAQALAKNCIRQYKGHGVYIYKYLHL